MKKLPYLLTCPRRSRRQRGAILPLVILGMIGMLAITGLVVDSGQLYLLDQRFQNAADSVGLAASLEMAEGHTDELLLTGIDQALLDNGITLASVIRVVNPPKLGAVTLADDATYAAPLKNTQSQGRCGSAGPDYVEVVIKAKKSFSTAFYSQVTTPEVCVNMTFSVGDVYSYAKTLCVLALNDKNSTGANNKNKTSSTENSYGVKVEGGNSTTFQTCGIQIMSSQTGALTVTKDVTLTADYINVLGGTNLAKKGLVTPKPLTGNAATSDPHWIAGDPFGVGKTDEVFPPSRAEIFKSSCDKVNYNNAGKSDTLQPGLYCGGILLTGSNVTIDMIGGTYVLLGNLKAQGYDNVAFRTTGTGKITGKNVFIYTTCGFGDINSCVGKNCTADRNPLCTSNTAKVAGNPNYGTLPSQCTYNGDGTVQCLAPGTFQLGAGMTWDVTGPAYPDSNGRANIVLFADRKVNNKAFIDEGSRSSWNILGGTFKLPDSALEDSIFYTPRQSVQISGNGEFYGSVYAESINVTSKIKIKKRKKKPYLKK